MRLRVVTQNYSQKTKSRYQKEPKESECSGRRRWIEETRWPLELPQ